MIKATFLLLTLTTWSVLSLPLHEKAVAKIDDISISLQQSESKQWNFSLQQDHINLAFMANLASHDLDKPFTPLQIKMINSENQEVKCPMKYANNLCVLEKSTQLVTVIVKCVTSKCDTNISLSQRKIHSFLEEEAHKTKMLTVPGQIFKMDKHNYTSILELYSQMKQQRLSPNQIKVYSNVHAFKLSQVQELDANSAIFGLKPIITDNQRFIYIQGNRGATNKQLRLTLKTHGGQLKDQVPVLDFIQTFGHRSISKYDYDGTFNNNIQLFTRIFAPRQPKGIPFGIIVQGRKAHGDVPTTIGQLHIKQLDFKSHKFQDISFTISKQRHQAFKIISFSFIIQIVQNKTIFLQIQTSDGLVSQINVFEDIYFSALKDQQLKFVANPQVKYQVPGQDKDLSIITNSSQKYFTNSNICPLHKGCLIQIKTTDKCQGCSFRFDLNGTDILNNVIYYPVKDNEVEAKIDIDQSLHFKKNMESSKIYQVVINTPNVMVYANLQNYQRCQFPSASCHQFAINQQNPRLITNNATKEQALTIAIVGLEKTTFRLKFISNQKGLQLQLGEKFSYLFDDEENEVVLGFTVNDQTFKKDETHLSFNLICPSNSLMLTVSNQDGMTYNAADGYIQFLRKDILGDKFTITIKKTLLYSRKFVHMTMIVSTSQTAIRLDSTATHYQKYLPLAQKKFVMDYDPNSQNLLNIFSQGLSRHGGKMKVTIVDINLQQVQQEQKPVISKLLQHDNQIIDLDFQLQNLDICQDINCQLQITIKSQSNFQIQQSITALHDQSVVALQDSIWTIYDVNQLSVTNHFYYVPRHKGNSITILFNSEDKSLFIDYNVVNVKGNFNPQDWPWGHKAHNSNQNDPLNTHLTGKQQFTIEGNDSQLVQCWPFCAILITLSQSQKVDTYDRNLIRTYKILVSSTVIQMPEDTQFQITMDSGEEDTMFIQLKNFVQRQIQQFTFFTTYRVGRAIVTASLLHNGTQYNLADNDKQFIFEQIQTHLSMLQIKSTLSAYKLSPQTTQIKLTFKALTTVKLYFEFTSYMRDFYRLQMDDLEVATLRQGEEVWYQFIPQRDFGIKLYRAKGFPLVKIIQCDEEGYIDCLTKHKKLIALQVQRKQLRAEKTKKQKAEEKNPKQQNLQVDDQLIQSTQKDLQLMVQKNYEYTHQQCEGCIFFIWIYGYAQDVQISINIRSSSTELQLKEMVTLNDRLTVLGYHNKYLINIEPSKTAIVTFRVVEGSALLSVSDSKTLLFNDTLNSNGADSVDVSVDALTLSANPADIQQENNNALAQYDQDDVPNIPPVFGGAPKNSLKHHILRHLHVKVTSLSQKPVEYLISYSMGYNGVYLQDGVVTQKKMQPDIEQIMYYHNRDKTSHAYLTLSSTVLEGYDQENSKNQYDVKFYYYPDVNRRDIKEEFVAEMPPKKNQNYLGTTITHVYELPAKFQLFQIEIYTKNYLKITASINHKQLIYLPLGFDYLIKLHKNQSIYIVVDSPMSDYLELTVKKCDTSVPTLYYTNDAREFQEGIYETQEEIQNAYESKMIKTKKTSKTIHLKFVGESQQISLFTVSVAPAYEALKSAKSAYKPKAGNSGVLSYITLAGSQVQVQFSPITCDGKKCPSIPQYYLMVSPTLDNIYGQLNCAGNSLVAQNTKYPVQSQLYQLTQANYDSSANLYRIDLFLKNQRSFMGVKAVMNVPGNKRIEVMYQPTQIMTLWKQVSGLSIGIFIIVSAAFAAVIAAVIIISTKVARRGYRPISEVQ